MDSGAYRNIVTIQKCEIEKNNVGSSKEVWSDYKKDYAYINGISGREYWAAAEVEQEKTVDFIFRWKPYYDEMNTRQYRIVYKGDIYNISSIDNVQMRNKTVKMRALKNDGKN